MNLQSVNVCSVKWSAWFALEITCRAAPHHVAVFLSLLLSGPSAACLAFVHFRRHLEEVEAGITFLLLLPRSYLLLARSDVSESYS